MALTPASYRALTWAPGTRASDSSARRQLLREAVVTHAAIMHAVMQDRGMSG
jgi:hypothetical protein